MEKGYKKQNELLTAELWVNLERKQRTIKDDIRKVKTQIQMLEKVGHHTRSVMTPKLEKILKKHTGKLRYVLKQMARPCHFVDHVITNISNTIASTKHRMNNYMLDKHVLVSK